MGRIYTARIMKCDERTPTDRIYPTDVVKKAIEEYMKIESRLGEMDGDRSAVDMSRVSHKVNKTYVDDDGWWIAEIEILGTPQGDILDMILEAGIKPKIIPRSIGSISCHSVHRVTDLNIIAIDVTSDPSFK